MKKMEGYKIKTKKGAHYFAVEKINSANYRTYNRYNDSKSYDEFVRIDKSVTHGDLIVAYIVG